MPGRLQSELRQGKPFATVEVEASLNLVRTVELMRHEVHQFLRPHGLTAAGYNVLRILRGAGEAGRTCGEIAERMVAVDPDVTRLIDRLVKHGLADRDRSTTDRRVVVVKVTRAGADLCTSLEAPLDDLHRRIMGHLGADRLRALITDLESIRARLGAPTPGPSEES
jgi:DNA-binding MarR family transcriptional regulator